MGNQLKYKIGTFSRNRACIGASTGHRPRYFFLQYLYRYETAVPGGFFKKKVYKLHTGTRYKGTGVLAYRYRLPTVRKNPGTGAVWNAYNFICQDI